MRLGGIALSALLLLGTVLMMVSAQPQELPKMSVPTLCYSQYFKCLGQHKSYCVWEYYIPLPLRAWWMRFGRHNYVRNNTNNIMATVIAA